MRHDTNRSHEEGKIRVLVIHNIYWAHYKAAVFVELGKACAERQIEYFVIHVAQTQHARAGMSGADEELHQYPHEVLFQRSFDDIPALARSLRLVKSILRFRPTVVVVPGYDDLAWWAALCAARMIGAKVIAAVDSTLRDHPRRWYRELSKRFFLSNCRAVFGYGHRSREYCLSLGVSSDRIFVRCQATQNSIVRTNYLRAQSELANSENPRRTFGYVGRMSREKNLGTLITAYQEMFSGAGIVPWRLLLVGAGPLEKELKEQARLTPDLPIEFLGGVSWKEIPSLMTEIDVVILPSVSEPWGLVINEAMLCERAVIVSDACGCVPELVIDGFNGFVFEPHDLQSLKGRMREFVFNPVRAREMGKNGLSIVSAFTPATAAGQMLTGIMYASEAHPRS